MRERWHILSINLALIFRQYQMKFSSESLSHGLAKARNQHYDCRKASVFGERERALELRISLPRRRGVLRFLAFMASWEITRETSSLNNITWYKSQLRLRETEATRKYGEQEVPFRKNVLNFTLERFPSHSQPPPQPKDRQQQRERYADRRPNLKRVCKVFPQFPHLFELLVKFICAFYMSRWTLSCNPFSRSWSFSLDSTIIWNGSSCRF